LAHAKVYVVPFCGQQTNNDEWVAALARASGFIRSELGRQIKTRLTPQLHFIYDESFEKADALSRLIHQAVEGDQSADEGDSSADV
jgi:ribosome-binding factor A